MHTVAWAQKELDSIVFFATSSDASASLTPVQYDEWLEQDAMNKTRFDFLSTRLANLWRTTDDLERSMTEWESRGLDVGPRPSSFMSPCSSPPSPFAGVTHRLSWLDRVDSLDAPQPGAVVVAASAAIPPVHEAGVVDLVRDEEKRTRKTSKTSKKPSTRRLPRPRILLERSDGGGTYERDTEWGLDYYVDPSIEHKSRPGYTAQRVSGRLPCPQVVRFFTRQYKPFVALILEATKRERMVGNKKRKSSSKSNTHWEVTQSVFLRQADMWWLDSRVLRDHPVDRYFLAMAYVSRFAGENQWFKNLSAALTGNISKDENARTLIQVSAKCGYTGHTQFWLTPQLNSEKPDHFGTGGMRCREFLDSEKLIWEGPPAASPLYDFTSRRVETMVKSPGENKGRLVKLSLSPEQEAHLTVLVHKYELAAVFDQPRDILLRPVKPVGMTISRAGPGDQVIASPEIWKTMMAKKLARKSDKDGSSTTTPEDDCESPPPPKKKRVSKVSLT